MSFILEPSFHSYKPETVRDLSVLPYKYLPHHNNLQSPDANLKMSWYQPGASDNYKLLNVYNIQTNQQYRNYLTGKGLEVQKYNNKTYRDNINKT